MPIRLDEAAPDTIEAGDVRFTCRRLGVAAGARVLGCSHYRVPAMARQMPVHVHGDEEEIFFVMGGSGLSWEDHEACAVASGDTVVHRAEGATHTFLSGRDGLELLAFASGSETHLTWLPRAQALWAGPRWVPVDAPDPFELESAAGTLDRPVPGQRPSNVVALDRVPVRNLDGAEVRALGAAAGSVKSGLNHTRLGPNMAGAPAHCHSLEEELFVILEGTGTLFLGEEAHELRTGDVFARPPGTGVPHELRAGRNGMNYLVYGTREPGDTVYYPGTGKVRLRGLGITLDV